jgi:hypothetical protein
MLLQANEVTIKSEHVVHTLVLEALNVDCLILCQFDQVSNFMLLRCDHLILGTETKIVGVDTQRVFMFLLH